MSYPLRCTAAKPRSRCCPGSIESCGHASAPIPPPAVLERSKPDLYDCLSARFAPAVAQALTLKILNLFLARFHFNARSASVLSRPFGLVIDPSNMCQLACPGCVHSSRSEEFKLFDWPKGTLSQDCFSALLKLYGPYAIGVYFCNYGEPLLNLATPKLIRLAKTYLIGTALSTSLSVRKFDAEAYVESGLDFMVLSIDGATQPVYEQYRRNGDIELVFDNIRKLVSARRKLGKRTPVLSWNFLAFEHNAHEIPLAARMARKLGVDRFRVVNPFDVRWDDPNIRPAPVKAGLRRLDWLSISSRPENWNPFPESLDGGLIAREFEKSWTIPALADDHPQVPTHRPAPAIPVIGCIRTSRWTRQGESCLAAARLGRTPTWCLLILTARIPIRLTPSGTVKRAPGSPPALPRSKTLPLLTPPIAPGASGITPPSTSAAPRSCATSARPTPLSSIAGAFGFCPAGDARPRLCATSINCGTLKAGAVVLTLGHLPRG